LHLEFKPLEIYLGSGETIRKKKYAYTEKLHFYAEKPRSKALNSQAYG